MTKLVPLLLFVLLAAACNNEDKKQKSENDVDAARNFIRAALDGNFAKAREYMLRDPLNEERIYNIERSYEQNHDREEKRNYREASITIYDTRKLNDSTTIVVYANSFMKKKDSLKAVRVQGDWLIDFKYTFLPPDSARHVQ